MVLVHNFIQPKKQLKGVPWEIARFSRSFYYNMKYLIKNTDIEQEAVF